MVEVSAFGDVISEPSEVANTSAFGDPLEAPAAGQGDGLPSLTAREPEQPTLFDRIFQPFQELPEETKARAWSAYALSEELNIPISTAYENQDAITKQIGVRGVPTTSELIGGLSAAPIAAGLMASPASTLIGLAGFQSIAEAESYAVSLASDGDYKLFQNKGLRDLLPEDASRLTKDVVEVIDLVGKGFLLGAGMHRSPKIAERLTKEMIVTHKLPEKLYIGAEALKAELQTGGVLAGDELNMLKELGLSGSQYRQALKDGLAIEIPAEKLVTLKDRPWFAKMKKLLGLEPSEPVVTRTGGGKAGIGEVPRKQIELKPNEAVESVPAAKEPVARLVSPEDAAAEKADRLAIERVIEGKAEPEMLVEGARIEPDIIEPPTPTREEAQRLGVPEGPEATPLAGRNKLRTELENINDDIRFIKSKDPAARSKKDIADLRSLESRKAQVEELISSGVTFVEELPRAAPSTPEGPSSKVIELRQSFINATKAARKAFREGNAIGVATQRDKMQSLLQSIRAEKERAALVSEVKKFQKPQGKIDVEYQKRIADLVQDFDFTKPTEKKIEQLKGLQNFIDENGVPLGINPARLKEIERLSKVSISDLSVDDLRSLRDELNLLKKIGKLKSKMRYKYNSKARKAFQKDIVDTTSNLDPVVGEGDTILDRVKIAGTEFYLDTLHTARVADLADGVRGYKGPQARLIKQSGRAVEQAITNSTGRVAGLFEFLSENNIPLVEAGSPSDIAMRANMAYREGYPKQAKSFLEAHGLEELPELTANEEKILQFIKDDMEKNKGDLIAAWEEVNESIFPEQEVYYLPFKYVGETDLAPEPGGGYRTTNVFDGFAKKRQPGSQRVLRDGVIQQYGEAVMEQEWYKSVQPVVEDIKSVILTDAYKQAAGDLMYSWWKDQADIMARRGWSSSAQMGAISNLLGRIRHNVSTGVLAFKLSTIMLQPFAAFDAAAYVNSRLGTVAAGKVLTEVTKTFLIPGRAAEIIAGSEALKQREGGELSISEELAKATSSSIKDTLTRKGFKLITATDVRTAAGVQSTVEKILLDEGLPAGEAKAEAEFIMGLTQASTNVALRPHILAKGEGARTWFNFQTFVMNRWGLLAHDFITGASKSKEFSTKFRNLISTGILVAAGLSEDEARKQVTKLTTGKEYDSEQSTPERAFLNLMGTIPFFGQIIEAASRGRDASPASLRILSEGAKGGLQIFSPGGKTAATQQKNRLRGFLKLSEAFAIIMLGAPGTAQFYDLLEPALIPPKKGKKKSL